MNIEILNNMLVPIIVVASLCIGYVIKQWLPTDDKWIPTILFIFGAVSGAILFGPTYDGIVKGALSGLASVGLHQLFKQFLKIEDAPMQIGYNFDNIEIEEEEDEEEYEGENDEAGEQ